jgi:hypothetical protein
MSEEKLGEDTHTLGAESYLRVRPKTGTGTAPAFYAPAADVTMGMKRVISTTLKQFGDANNPALMEFAGKLAMFMKSSAMSNQIWEQDGLGQLENLFTGVPENDVARFLTAFFTNTMDFYWHSMRMTTECPEINPEEMQKALDVSMVIRTMPADMRERYIDHLRTYNLLPQILNRPGLFEYKKG